MPKPSTEPAAPIVQYQLENKTYQLDLGKRKVYRRFVEIETARAFEILSRWRAENAPA